MDLLGVSRTIDHAVYTAFNALASALWRLDAALLGMSIFGYQTQDWLTGRDGQGVWFLLAKMSGTNGMVGLATWRAFLALALILYGLSLVIRPFLRIAPVDIGRLLLYAIVAYLFITQGNRLMQEAEQWRAAAGSYIYRAMADSDVSALMPPGGNPASTDDPLHTPGDLDGSSPIRGWEAVGSSYFLAQTAAEIHDVVPPHDFRVAYCLYDPRRPIDDQSEENRVGCSPRNAWDEWDMVSTGTITTVFGIPINIGISLPISQDHPENRQLGIRQAQAGAARLALGPVVALFPLLEANVGLMLALSAAFIYLSLPIMLLFGFFRATEALAVGLMFQYLNIIIRTIILQGLLALFLMILIGVAARGSLTGYLGLIGVGLMGGFFLSRMATATLRETMTQTMGAVGRLWTGAAVGAFGEAARKPAQKAFGATTLATAGLTAGAMIANGGLGRALDIAEPALDVSRGGLRDLKGERSVTQVGQPMPDSLLVLAQQSRTVVQRRTSPGQPPRRVAAAQAYDSPARTVPTAETWARQWYRAQASGHGQEAVRTAGYARLGETLPRRAEPVLRRHRQSETGAVLRATRKLARENPDRFFEPDGTLSAEGVRAVRRQLNEPTRRAFSGTQGARDLETLVAVGAQSDRRAAPADFRRETARAKNGFSDNAPGRTIPRALGLDAAAGGAHVAEMNRFVRLSERVGLSERQREQLLTEARHGEISPQLRQKIEDRVQQSGTAIKSETLISAARAMPDTLSGPRHIRFGHQSAARHPAEKETLRRVAEAGRAEGPPEIATITAAAAPATSLPQALRQTPPVPRGRAVFSVDTSATPTQKKPTAKKSDPAQEPDDEEAHRDDPSRD